MEAEPVRKDPASTDRRPRDHKRTGDEQTAKNPQERDDAPSGRLEVPGSLGRPGTNFHAMGHVCPSKS